MPVAGFSGVVGAPAFGAGVVAGAVAGFASPIVGAGGVVVVAEPAAEPVAEPDAGASAGAAEPEPVAGGTTIVAEPPPGVSGISSAP